MEETSANTATFWDHLDELRSVFIKMGIAVALVSCVAFAFKDVLFAVVLAPSRPDFCLYRWIGAEPFVLQLMNTQLTEQFMIHIKVAFYVGVMIVSPYILYLLFSFVSPALYKNERKYSKLVVISAFIMFFMGTLLNYFLIFPLTVRFLGTYQVASDVANMLTISNYVGTLLSMNMLMGIIFELPVICWIAGRMGLISRRQMQHFRRHAIVVILIVAAIITPTTDVFTLIVVSLPIWLLYELSIFMVGNEYKKLPADAQ